MSTTRMAASSRRKSSTKFPNPKGRQYMSSRSDEEAAADSYPTPQSMEKRQSNDYSGLNYSPKRTNITRGDSLDQHVEASQFPAVLSPSTFTNRLKQSRGSAIQDDSHHLDGSDAAHRRSAAKAATTRPPSRKRTMSMISGDPQPEHARKRVHFSPKPVSQPESTSPKTPVRALTEADLIPRYPKALLVSLLEDLSRSPRILTLTQISGCLRLLQELTEEFSRKWFGQANDSSIHFPFHRLKEDHPALFFTTQYILDASTTTGTTNDGWQKFFTNPELCQYLVFGVLGEWFIQRIFKHTGFGLSAEMQEYLSEHIDKEYLHHDAIVRAKLRGNYIKEHWNKYEHSADIAHQILLDASDGFTKELIIVLAPLISSYIPDSQKVDKFKTELSQIVASCAGTHLSMLCTGSNGTVFIYPGAKESGNVFHRDHDHFQCVNPAVLEPTSPSEASDEALVIKMTCWTRIEAYVPSGKDMIELADHQEKLARKLVAKKQKELGCPLVKEQIAQIKESFDWYDSTEGRETWEPLPQDLWAAALENVEKQDMLAKNSALRKRLELDNQTPTQDHNDSESDSDTSPLASRSRHALFKYADNDKEPRGAYMTIYYCICPHVVYCEWTKKELAANASHTHRNSKSPKSPSLRETNTLAAAVAKARSNLVGLDSLTAQRQDLARYLWDTYARNSLSIEWGFFLMAFVSGMAVHYGGTDVLPKVADLSTETLANFVSKLKEAMNYLKGRKDLVKTFGQAIMKINLFLTAGLRQTLKQTAQQAQINGHQQMWADGEQRYLEMEHDYLI